MNSKLIYFLFLFSFTTMSFNIQDRPKKFDYGEIENGIYSNKFFDMKMILPDKWIFQSNKEISELMKSGEKLITGNDEKLKSMLKAAKITTANLFAGFKYEKGAPVDFNPSILLVAENLKSNPGIKTGEDYLFNA